MISVENLRQHCRTCLVELDNSIENDNHKYISTNKFPELEHLIQVCLARITAGDDSLPYYVPFLCHSCFRKWLEFLKLYKVAVECDEKIRTILEKEVLKDEFNDNIGNLLNNNEKEDINEYFINSEILVDINDADIYEKEFATYTKEASQPNNEIQNKEKSIDALIHGNGKIKSEQINKIELETKFVDGYYETDSSLSNDVDIIPEVVRNPKSMDKLYFLRNKKSRKSLLMLKKQKTRNVLYNVNDNQARLEMQTEHSADVGNNGAKKVRYKCEPCNKYFWKKNKYDGHLKQVHEGIRRPYQCLQCNKAYNLYKSLLQHKRESHSEKSHGEFKCEKCEKIFKTAVILKQHIHNKHSEQKESTRSICDQCGFIAAHQYSLSRHIINKHTETDQIKCDQCPKVFKTQYSLKYHVIGNHTPTNNKPFKCPECQMGFTRKTLLNQHKRTHLKYTERIKCDFEGCEVRFVKHGDKTHHMRLVHLKIKQHICDFCGEAFGAMQTLRHHRFIHTGEKPYKCGVCGQGFRQRTAMKTHWKTHFGRNEEKKDIINNLKEVNLSLALNA